MRNQTMNSPLTAGEIETYKMYAGGKITATYGNTEKGIGWRPVCRGRYLGSACCQTEREAIIHGKTYFANLKQRMAANLRINQPLPRMQVSPATTKPEKQKRKTPQPKEQG